MYDLLLKSVLEIFKETIRQNQKRLTSFVFWKSYFKNVWKIPRKPSTTERILKAHNYAEYELCHWCFPRNFMEKFRTAILKEYFLIDAPCLIKEHLRMSASDEAALKFLTQERQTFPQSNILSHILCLLIYYIGEHNIFYYKDFFSLVLTFLFHEHNSLFCNCKSRD